MTDDALEPEPMKIENRPDFVQWAIERSQAIVADQGGDLALAARDHSDQKVRRDGQRPWPGNRRCIARGVRRAA